MPRLARCVTFAVFAVVIASSGADARTKRHHPGAFAGVYNSASDADLRRGTSTTDARQQCYEEAQKRVSSSNQDLQTVRDYAYRNCAFDHGLPP